MGQVLSKCSSIIAFFVICLSLTPAWASNSHGLASEAEERQAWWGDGLKPYISSGCIPATSGTLTFAAIACQGYVSNGGQMTYVDQAASTIGPLSDGDGDYWLAIHRDRTGTVGSWTRHGSTHFLWQKATPPLSFPLPGPSEGLVFAKATVAGTAITIATPFAYRSPIDAALTSHAVESWGAIGNDTIDDSPSIVQAIKAQFAAGGGVVRFGRGVFVMNAEPIVMDLIDTSLTLEGCGSTEAGWYDGCTVLHWTGGAERVIEINRTVRNIIIRGIDINNTGTATHLIWADGVDILRLQDVNMRPQVAPSDSIMEAGPTAGTRLENLYLDNVTMRTPDIEGGDICLRAPRVQDFFATRFNTVNCETIIGVAASLDTVNWSCSGCTHNGGANQDALRIHSAHSIAYHGGHFECDGAGYCINILSSAQDLQSIAIYGGYFVAKGHGNTTPYAIHIQDAEAELTVHDAWVGQFDGVGASWFVRNTASSRISLFNNQIWEVNMSLISSTTTGSVTMIGNAAKQVMLPDHLHFKQTKTHQIFEPDIKQPISRYVVLQRIEADEFPSGVELSDITVSTDIACTSTVTLILRTNDGTSWTTTATVEAITLSGTETPDDGSLTNNTMAVGDYLVLDFGAGVPCNVGTMDVTWKFKRL